MFVRYRRKLILLTDINPEVQEIYKNACGDYSKVEFQEAEYSYEYLLGLEDVVADMREEMAVYEYYVDVKNNTFNIGVEQATAVSSKMQSQSKNLPIVIYEMDEIPEATAMKGGEAISNGNGSPFSICFFGTYNGKDALITCGHTNYLNRSIYYGGTQIGTVVKQNLRTFVDTGNIDASYGDFSIVDIDASSIGGSNYVKWQNGTSKYVTRVANVVVGLEVGMYGNTSGYLSGTVKNTMVTADFEDPEDLSTYRVKGLTTIEGSNTTQGGDSGGCVVYTTSNGNNRIAGCITGSRSGAYSYITPVSYIESSGFTFN